MDDTQTIGGVTIRHTGRVCRRCDWQCGTVTVSGRLNDQTQLGLRSLLERLEAKVVDDGGTCSWRTVDVDADDAA